jgi:hypothetical protein
MKGIGQLLLAATFLLMAACNYQKIVETMTPKAESQFAKEFLLRLQRKDFAYVRQHSDQKYRAELTDAALEKITAFYPAGKLLDTTIVGSYVNVSDARWQGEFTFEFHFSAGWTIASAVINKVDNKLSVWGFHVYPTTAVSRQELNQFSFAGKTWIQYLTFALVITAPIFVLLTAIVCARTPLGKNKWLWMIFVLLGVGSLSVNWTTGDWELWPFYVKLLSASFVKNGPYAPWIFSAAFPLGAICFWFKRASLKYDSPTDLIE